MPQFDKITFFNQVFWLFFFFSTLYIVLLKGFLPRLAELLKARTKKLKNCGLGVDNYLLENNKTMNNFNILFENRVVITKLLINRTQEGFNEWLEKKFGSNVYLNSPFF